MTTVEIGGRSVELVCPASYAVRSEIWLASATNQQRAAGAALGACWRGSSRPKVDYRACAYDPLRYGGMVIDELHSRGCDLREIMTAGIEALRLVSQDMLHEQEVADAADFSDAEAASTG